MNNNFAVVYPRINREHGERVLRHLYRHQGHLLIEALETLPEQKSSAVTTLINQVVQQASTPRRQSGAQYNLFKTVGGVLYIEKNKRAEIEWALGIK